MKYIGINKETVTGVLLAGIGHVDNQGHRTNFFVVDQKTQMQTLEAKFLELITRNDLAILLINQHVADMIRGQIDDYQQQFPTILEIPSKDHPYDPSKDSVLRKVRKLCGTE